MRLVWLTALLVLAACGAPQGGAASECSRLADEAAASDLDTDAFDAAIRACAGLEEFIDAATAAWNDPVLSAETWARNRCTNTTHLRETQVCQDLGVQSAGDEPPGDYVWAQGYYWPDDPEAQFVLYDGSVWRCVPIGGEMGPDVEWSCEIDSSAPTPMP